MDRTPPAAHAAHDESLIARLFGGDVDAVERERAMYLMGGCGECASLFADLGDIAAATRAMPVPVRPRDFSLIAADAARLSRRRWLRPSFSGAGLRRSLGGSLAALGLIGFMLTGAVSLFGGTATSSNDFGSLTTGERGAAPVYAPGAGADNGMPSAVYAAPTEAVAVVSRAPSAAPSGSSPKVVFPGATPPPAGQTDQPGPALVGNGSPAPASSAGVESQQKDGANPQHGAVRTDYGSGIDARLLWLVGFAVLFLVGLGAMLLPWFIGRRRRGSRS